MSRERQQKKAQEMRGRILEIARDIVSREGPDALSIRRITKEMDYSAGSLYHYFSTKDEILHQLLLDGYGKILAAIGPPMDRDDPGEAIAASIRSYIDGVLTWPEEYRAVMFSSKEDILAVTSVLDADVGEKRRAMEWLIAKVEQGVERGVFAPCDPVLTAQSLWCAMFGLVARIIVEQAMPEDRKNKLIDRHLDLLMKGMMA